MNELPLWAAILVALLLILAGLVTLIGSLGLLRLRTFYQRMHAPTLGMTLGAFCVALAATLVASLLQGRPIFHEWLICLFLFMSAPVTAILLMQSAIRRRIAPAAPPDQPPAGPARADAEPPAV
ncbi:monovalent cation/H(+) antiporter subunit G [uncultured Castellaniella sp.]|uniref:monovalent cation/H(+) antiporter subunit G n=1 Tax=uncultured Castellaniella sp. TaxID=647907 RepID=UPI002639D184|nr:monovalent cation/H(+) antiporter subunit G [uncultured Castellaniella sp.]